MPKIARSRTPSGSKRSSVESFFWILTGGASSKRRQAESDPAMASQTLAQEKCRANGGQNVHRCRCRTGWPLFVADPGAPTDPYVLALKHTVP